MDRKKIIRQMDEHPETWNVRRMTADNTLEGYKYLLGLKNRLPKELYASLLRDIWTMKTEGISIELGLEMFNDVLAEDLMYDDELAAIDSFNDTITVYRGASTSEDVPRLSWTLRKSEATNSDFARGRLFVANISKNKIIMYVAHDGCEEEVVAHVTENYEIIDE